MHVPEIFLDAVLRGEVSIPKEHLVIRPGRPSVGKAWNPTFFVSSENLHSLYRNTYEEECKRLDRFFNVFKVMTKAKLSMVINRNYSSDMISAMTKIDGSVLRGFHIPDHILLREAGKSYPISSLITAIKDEENAKHRDWCDTEVEQMWQIDQVEEIAPLPVTPGKRNRMNFRVLSRRVLTKGEVGFMSPRDKDDYDRNFEGVITLLLEGRSEPFEVSLPGLQKRTVAGKKLIRENMRYSPLVLHPVFGMKGDSSSTEIDYINLDSYGDHSDKKFSYWDKTNKIAIYFKE